jgi:hypothetical protein
VQKSRQIWSFDAKPAKRFNLWSYWWLLGCTMSAPDTPASCKQYRRRAKQSESFDAKSAKQVSVVVLMVAGFFNECS